LSELFVKTSETKGIELSNMEAVDITGEKVASLVSKDVIMP
jgi:hypothetical protein